jgi:hypothetical protein
VRQKKLDAKKKEEKVIFDYKKRRYEGLMIEAVVDIRSFFSIISIYRVDESERISIG